jgi:anhydro-N-acetylmuramic acid kinase
MFYNATVAGMISGTSADAVNVALVHFEEENAGEVEFELLAFEEFKIEKELRQRILDACASQANTRQICELNFELGETFSTALNQITKSSALSTPVPEWGQHSALDLIASHGQTVWHQVEEGLPLSTLQIGEPAVITERTGITVASNFRVADMAAGGQAAPLVSFFDYVFFADPNKTRALQNIGGIGNVTFLPAGQGTDAVWAFDTGPGNMLLDFAAHNYTQGELNYDKDGQIAAAGRVDEAWLNEMMSNPYFRQKPPKSTGRELFGLPFWQQVLSVAESQSKKAEDVLATLTAFTARSIVQSYRDFGPVNGVDEVIVSGGGALNPTLMQMLAQEFGPDVIVKRHDDFGLSAQAKEAVAFALFGYELLRGRAANLPSCTGASHPVWMGQFTPGANFARLMRRFLAADENLEEENREQGWQEKPTIGLRKLRLKPKE